MSEIAQSQKPFRALIKGSWNSTAGVRLKFFAFVGAYTVSNLLELLSPWAIGYTLGVFVQEGFTDESFKRGVNGILIYTGLRLLIALFHHLGRYLQVTAAYSTRMFELERMFGQLMSFPLRWHIRYHSGENLSKLQRSVGAVESMIGTYIWQIIEGLIKLFGAGTALFYLDFRVATNVVLISLLSVYVMVRFNAKLQTKIRRNNAFANRLNSICIDYLFNIVTIKTLACEQAVIRQINTQKPIGAKHCADIARYSELKWSATDIGYALVIGSSLFIYFYNQGELKSAVDVASVYVLLNYLDRVFQAIGSFTGYYGGILEAATAYEDAVAIEQNAQQIKRTQQASLPPPQNWDKILIQQMDFSYESGQSRGLQNVEFNIHLGEKIALVGPSGSGKSTILKVMAGLLAPDTAIMETSAQESVSTDQLAKLCLLVPQEPEIFSDTVLYNITLDEYSDNYDEIERMLLLCQLTELVRKMPEGLQTVLTEKGHNLSGGEKQRIALARGLLRCEKRPILLLDEPTSSLDPKTEKLIFQGIMERYRDRTILTACHRLLLVPLFDTIIFVAGGRVVEQGSFDELIAKQGFFYRTWCDYQKAIKSDDSTHWSVNS